ncbi:MAG: type II secretion system F family protein [Acidimicrobiia bacterium]
MTGVLPIILGLGWGALVAMPLLRGAERVAVVSRLEVVESAPRPVRFAGPLRGDLVQRWMGPAGRVLSGMTERRACRRREAEMARELPVVIDLLAVGVGAGCTPYLSVEVASQWAPAPLAARLEEVRRDCSLGVGFADALERMGSEHAPLRTLVDALLASERYGAPVGDALSRLAVEERSSLRRRAEARARTVPVRLLFPLVFLVLPAFALLSVVPVLLAGLKGT